MRQIIVEHGGKEYRGEIMTIDSTHLGWQDHGIFDLMLHCSGDGIGTGVGGYALDEPVRDADGNFIERRATAYGHDFIIQIMKTVGVSEWEKLRGKQIVVLYLGGSSGLDRIAAGIAHPIEEDKIFIFQEHVENWQAN